MTSVLLMMKELPANWNGTNDYVLGNNRSFLDSTYGTQLSTWNQSILQLFGVVSCFMHQFLAALECLATLHSCFLALVSSSKREYAELQPLLAILTSKRFHCVRCQYSLRSTRFFRLPICWYSCLDGDLLPIPVLCTPDWIQFSTYLMQGIS